MYFNLSPAIYKDRFPIKTTFKQKLTIWCKVQYLLIFNNKLIADKLQSVMKAEVPIWLFICHYLWCMIITKYLFITWESECTFKTCLHPLPSPCEAQKHSLREPWQCSLHWNINNSVSLKPGLLLYPLHQQR